MEILKISAFALIAAIVIVLIKQERKEIGVTISILAAVMLAVYAILKLDDVVSLVFELVANAGINSKYLEIILKVVGIAYIIELSKDVCVDSGETALAGKVEMAGKIMIMSMTIPIITGVIEVINKLI